MCTSNAAELRASHVLRGDCRASCVCTSQLWWMSNSLKIWDTGFNWFLETVQNSYLLTYCRVCYLYVCIYIYIVCIYIYSTWFYSRANKIANKKRMWRTVISGLLPKFSMYDWDQEEWLVGGWPTPLKNMKVNWGYYSPNIWKNKTCSKPPTRMISMLENDW